MKKDLNQRLKKRLRKRRIKKITAKKVPAPGPIEGMKLKFSGFSDGRSHNFHQVDDQNWTSTFIQLKESSLDHFNTILWAELDLEQADEFQKMELLIKKLETLQGSLSDYQNYLSSGNNIDTTLRFKGEDSLTEEQVKKRRLAEKQKKEQGILAKRNSMREEYQQALDELSELLSTVHQNISLTKLISVRLRLYFTMCVNLYWRSLTKACKEKDLPTVFGELKFSSEAEDTFLKNHDSLLARADELCSTSQS